MKPPASTKEKFLEDLSKGKAFEEKVANKFKELGYIVETNPDEKGPWDLTIEKDGVKQTVEIKCDFRALDTGNIALEMIYRGKPSGILNTGIDVWVHGVGEAKAYMIPFAALKEEVDKAKFRYMPMLGDGSSGLLVPIKKFELFKDVQVLESI